MERMRFGPRTIHLKVGMAYGRRKRGGGIMAGEDAGSHMGKGPVTESQCTMHYPALGHTGVSYWLVAYGG